MHPPDTKKSANDSLYRCCVDPARRKKRPRPPNTPKMPAKNADGHFARLQCKTPTLTPFGDPPETALFGQLKRKNRARTPKIRGLRLRRTHTSCQTAHPHPKCNCRTPTASARRKNARDQIGGTPCLKTVLTQGQNRPKRALFDAVWALLTPRTGCGREKTRFFAKNRKCRTVTPSDTSQISGTTPQFGHDSCLVAFD